ncbi:MAG: hypothetical protein HY814_07910 [Candidatus Riflebacteria bacterium]|nr:hypothetical protein [Candidatus Riflebacteria bacterium]
MIRRILIVALLLVVAAVARYYVFRLQDMDIAPDYYERKLKLEDFGFPEPQIPQGYRLSAQLPGGLENPSRIPPDRAAGLVTPRIAFPEPDRLTAAYASSFESTLGDRVLVVAGQYLPGPQGTPEAPMGFLREGVFMVTVVAAAPVQREVFTNALSERLDRVKKFGVKLNKLKTIGNVLLKLFMNILVGGFVFLLMLFLAKYFLIIRQVEE